MKTTLCIDTGTIGKITLSLVTGDTKCIRESSATEGMSQKILYEIEQICIEADKDIQLLDEIRYVQKGNTFTGLRIGAAVAHTIGWLMGIPVNGKKAQESPEISYENDRWG